MDNEGKLVFDVMDGQHVRQHLRVALFFDWPYAPSFCEMLTFYLQMQFSIEDFTEKITLPYLLDKGDDSKKHRKHCEHGEHKEGKDRNGKRCRGVLDPSRSVLQWDMQQQEVL